MKIEKYEKTGKNKYRLYLDNGEVIDTYDNVILKNDLLLKKELSLSDYQLVMVESNIEEHYLVSLKYISVRIRSSKEIRDYLKRRNVSDSDIDIIIEKLIKDKALNDEYFCECFIKDKLRFTTMGEYRIINELKKHQISDEIIYKYSYLMDEDIIMDKIEKIVDKQIRSNHKLDNYKLRNKIYNHLLGLGYSSNMIVEVLNNKF